MNWKHILFPCPGIFQPPSLPQNFPLLLTSAPLLPTSPLYLPHLISHSFHLQSLGELPSLSSTMPWNTRLEEGGELNVEGMWKGESKRGASSQMQKWEKKSKLPLFSTFFFFFMVFFLCVFLFFLLLKKKKMPRESVWNKSAKTWGQK